ncbi:probable cytochrome P450 301a1, mitochondrial [Periplaneta americana]|uniref:probable cytochrome P450 301a1, mitochondrial n=1 Tax=Periplaneta americana TaxID=6978 RepID=UPI0037E7E7AE
MLPGISAVSAALRSDGRHSVSLGLSRLAVKRSATAATSAAEQEDWNNAKPYEEIPGPKPLPLVGNIWRFLPIIGEYSKMEFEEQWKHFHKTFGNIMKLTLFSGKKEMVVLFNPDDVEKVFRNEGPSPSREPSHTIKYYRTVTRKDLFQDMAGSISMSGEEWRTFRSKVNQPMMQPRVTKLYVAPINSVADDFLKRIKSLRNEKQEMPENFMNELHKWSLESIVYIAMDKRLGCLEGELAPDSDPQKMIDAVRVIFDGIYKMEHKISLWQLISTPTWREFVKAFDVFTEISMKYINEALQRMKETSEDSEKETTVLQRLLSQDSNPLYAVVMAQDMMVAGIESTSYTTAETLYYLAKNQDKQEKLFQEIHRVLPDKTQPITYDILNELKYLKACIKECMRITPVAIGLHRKLPKDIVLSNYRVHKGVDAVIPLILLSNMEKYFPQADKYIPERWLKNDEFADKKMTHPFVYLPFGFGPRMCLGRRFADLEMETVIAKIIRNFKIEYEYGDMKFESKLLYTPVSPLRFKMVDRTT